MDAIQLTAEFVNPPIPCRNYDFQVLDRENWEPGNIIGYGRNIPEAIDDYLDQYEAWYNVDREQIKYKWQ